MTPAERFDAFLHDHLLDWPDTEGRWLGETAAAGFRTAEEDVAPCPYAGRAGGMNAAALRQVNRHWPTVLDTLGAWSGPTAGAAWRATCRGRWAPLWHARPLPGPVAATFKTALGLHRPLTAWLLASPGAAAAPLHDLVARPMAPCRHPPEATEERTGPGAPQAMPDIEAVVVVVEAFPEPGLPVQHAGRHEGARPVATRPKHRRDPGHRGGHRHAIADDAQVERVAAGQHGRVGGSGERGGRHPLGEEGSPLRQAVEVGRRRLEAGPADRAEVVGPHGVEGHQHDGVDRTVHGAVGERARGRWGLRRHDGLSSHRPHRGQRPEDGPHRPHPGRRPASPSHAQADREQRHDGPQGLRLQVLVEEPQLPRHEPQGEHHAPEAGPSPGRHCAHHPRKGEQHQPAEDGYDVAVQQAAVVRPQDPGGLNQRQGHRCARGDEPDPASSRLAQQSYRSS